MGGAYLMTNSALRRLLSAAQTTPLFPFEDVYMGLCAARVSVNLKFPTKYLQSFIIVCCTLTKFALF